MGRKSIYSAEEKICAIKEYLDGKNSIRAIAEHLGIHSESFRQWIAKYESMGADGFITNQNKYYSKLEKERAVNSYLAGDGSYMDICKKYQIHSPAQLKVWVKKYNGHEELKASGTGGTVIMTKGRKTTFEERIEIVQYCIAHDYNYAEASVSAASITALSSA